VGNTGIKSVTPFNKINAFDEFHRDPARFSPPPQNST